MSEPGELTCDEAMDRGRAALLDSERLYDDIDAAVAALQPSRPSPDGKSLPAPHNSPHAEDS
jgi:hypothetical protein